MVKKQHVKIIAFVGLSGSGKTSATNYVVDLGVPRVSFATITEVISQIQHLVTAGQHQVVVDGIDGWESYKTIKHSFPGSLVVVALLADKHIRVKRLASRPEEPLTEPAMREKDDNEVVGLNVGGVIAMSDYFLVGSHSLEQLFAQIDGLLEQENWFKD